MRGPAYVLAIGEPDWTAARVDDVKVRMRSIAASDADFAAMSASAASALAELGRRAQSVALALPTRMVLVAHVECGDLPRRQRRAAMLYRLEEQLPVDAEALTADFLPAAAGRAMGVAVQHAQVRAMLDGLAQAGVQVSSICPTALLALWRMAGHSRGRADYMVLFLQSCAEVFRMSDGRPAAWHSCDPVPEAILRCIEADILVHSLERRPTVLLSGPGSDGAAEVLCHNGALDATVDTGCPPLELAALSAGELLAGRPTGWVELRREALGAGSRWTPVAGLLRGTVVAALLLLAVIAGVCQLRAMRYDGVARRNGDLQAVEFAKLYPGRPVPPGVKSRLKSDLMRLSAVSGADAELPRQDSALQTLRHLIGGLPPAVRLQISELRVAPGGVLVEGLTRTHTDAEIISQFLNKAGFAMDPPRTEQAATGGVSFALAGRLLRSSGGNP